MSAASGLYPYIPPLVGRYALGLNTGQTFTSHQFILQLAWQEQELYIKALQVALVRAPHAPFQHLHGQLGRRLVIVARPQFAHKKFWDKDIFGHKVSNVLYTRL